MCQFPAVEPLGPVNAESPLAVGFIQKQLVTQLRVHPLVVENNLVEQLDKQQQNSFKILPKFETQ